MVHICEIVKKVMADLKARRTIHMKREGGQLFWPNEYRETDAG
jgi:hypothetical protein